ncbi:MAG: hypothetical protein WCI27_01960 [Candidatus Omnitrophota bacterium]
MLVLLVLNVSADRLQVVVRVRQKRMILKVISLLEANRYQEAFGILRDHAPVEAYFLDGEIPDVKVCMTLLEDARIG